MQTENTKCFAVKFGISATEFGILHIQAVDGEDAREQCEKHIQNRLKEGSVPEGTKFLGFVEAK